MACWQLLRIGDMNEELLNGIKSMCVNSLACVKVENKRKENGNV